MDSSSANAAYPRLIRRIKGAMIDGIIIPIAAIGVLVLIDSFGVESGVVKAICAALIILLLEPLAVVFTGGTIGHHVLGMRVRRKNEDKRLGIFAALTRFVTKTLFGIFSFFVALITQKRQSLHDVAANSVVVYKSTIGLPEYEILPEITRADEQRTYVSVWRRMLVIFLYWLLCWTCFNIIIFAGFDSCVNSHACSNAQNLSVLAIFSLLLASFLIVAILGWRGKLFGCRKQVT
jgi:uncharacterized RDD family membrane protein YckC